MADEAGGSSVSDIGKRVLALCAEALSLEAVRPEDNFFELGGDSLSAMWLLSSIQDELKIEIPLPELFDAQVMKDLVLVVERQVAQGAANAPS